MVKLYKAGTRKPLRIVKVRKSAPASEPTVLAGEEPKHVGGGWYELPDGSKVQGKDAADEAMRDEAMRVEQQPDVPE